MKTTRADRRQNINSYAQWVYGLYLEGELVYVGVTADPAARLVDHQTKKHFDEMRLIKGFSSRFIAEDFEKYSILTLNPPLNIVKLGTNYEPSQIAAKDFSLFLNCKNLQEFDFELLDNLQIKKRRSWERYLDSQNPVGYDRGLA